MKRFVGVLVAVAIMVPVARTAMAQSKTITGETKVVTATVEAIEASSRTLTLKNPDGTYVTTTAPADMKRFSEIKVGDRVSARYYENMVIRVKQPGEKDVDTASAATTPSGMSHPGAPRRSSGRSRRRSRPSTRACRRSPSPARTAGSTRRRCRTRRPWPA